MKTIKTAVSLPTEVYQKAEKLRKKLNKSRSELVAEALGKLVKDAEVREMEARDAAAYRRYPETAEEIALAQFATEEAWKNLDDDWSEEYNATK